MHKVNAFNISKNRLIILGSGIFVFTVVFLLQLEIFSQPYIKITECMQWGVKLPETFQQDIPIYAPSKLLASFVDCQDNKQRILLALLTPDDLSKTQIFYEEEMAKNKWVDNGVLEYPTVKKLRYKKSVREVEILLEHPIIPIQFATFGRFKNTITITYSIPR